MEHSGKIGIAAFIVVATGIFAYSRQTQAAITDQPYQQDYTPYYPDISQQELPFSYDPFIISDFATTPPNMEIFSTYSPLDIPTIGANMNYKINEYPKYASAISDAEQRYGLPTDLEARVLYQESRYRADIIAGDKRSNAGAIGIGQFMPDTAARFNINPRDPFASIDATGKYLKYLHDLFGSWKPAIMAYNWGEGNVQHWLNGDINSRTGKPYTPPGETANYVAQITADVNVA